MYNKLTVSVDLLGRVGFLNNFPTDEFHGAIKDMLDGELHSFESNEAPGIYLATLVIERTNPCPDRDAYVEICRMERVY